MKIIQNEAGNRGKFIVQKEGLTLAKIEYLLPDGNTLSIQHTEVDEALRGQKVGYLLVEKVVEYARNKHLKIISSCPFASAILSRKTKEYEDVLKNTI
ncbi:MAG: N-acetyltransferase [Bacteroidetes bacterium]|nr:N-acetyltransferase [Bacteroidota bacterium]MBS1757753.1 N-acetyltransferase [Bacteroidota bacterium]